MTYRPSLQPRHIAQCVLSICPAKAKASARGPLIEIVPGGHASFERNLPTRLRLHHPVVCLSTQTVRNALNSKETKKNNTLPSYESIPDIFAPVFVNAFPRNILAHGWYSEERGLGRKVNDHRRDS